MPERLAIVGGCRTPIGSFGGGLKDVSAAHLLATCFKEVFKRSGVNHCCIDEVVVGNVCQPSDAANIARVAALLAGLPVTIPARTVQRNCASGIESISSAYQSWKAGDAEMLLVGGAENMSQVPYLLKGARWGYRLQHFFLVDGLWEGLTDPVINQIMGRTAESVAQKHGIGREEQDAFAVQSHQKAFRAKREGKFKSQTVPVTIQTVANIGGKPLVNEKTVAEDECINPALTRATAALQPAFFLSDAVTQANYPKSRLENEKVIIETKIDNSGTVTPKNACPISDGAAALLLMPETKARTMCLQPLAYIVSYAYAACDPAYMGEGPIYAVPLALKKAGLTINDIDFFELNEAFAAQALACQKALAIPDEKLNVWGGAIAMGHPVGATGSLLTVKATHILQEYQKRYAAITMCVGGGQGGCLIIERA